MYAIRCFYQWSRCKYHNNYPNRVKGNLIIDDVVAVEMISYQIHATQS
jgi:hypothetical protein